MNLSNNEIEIQKIVSQKQFLSKFIQKIHTFIHSFISVDVNFVNPGISHAAERAS